MKIITTKITVTGVVQGVGFRPFIYRTAKKNRLFGHVANKGNFVEIILQGLEKNIDQFKEDISSKKPPLAIIENMLFTKLTENPEIYENFVISNSDINLTKTTSYIPSDVAICDQCLNDMYKGDRKERYHYPFTSCVDCGPRFTVIKSLPYDRPSTTMVDFPLCEKCIKEYTNPLDRRYHAQTTCCSECGPKYAVYNKSGEILDYKNENLIGFISQQLNKGKIVAIKGIGGTHIACSVNSPEPIRKIRQTKGDRKRKPFALMSRSLDAIKQFADIPGKNVENLLLSPKRPIVLLPQKDPFPLQEDIAPSLHNIGVMLPYSGIHYLLLDNIESQTLVMTSANRSHEPIQIDNNEIIKDLNEIVDYFLLHDREIYQRADDSVIKPLILTSEILKKELNLFIRKSRGYVPEPISCPDWKENSVLLGVSSELHTTGSVAINKKMFLTQYIGNLGYEKTLRFLESSIKNLLSILQDPSIEKIISDLHPSYISTDFGRELSNNTNSRFEQVQHHFAHGSALLGENLLFSQKSVIFVGDGLGYGEDGNIWGGEFLKGSIGNFKRINHWDYVQQPGGDLATKYPVRMIVSYLLKEKKSKIEVKELINHLNLSKQEFDLIVSQCKKNINSPLTSSTGRFLDAISVLLKITTDSSYEGEPAIVLESTAMKIANNNQREENILLKEYFAKTKVNTRLSLLVKIVAEKLKIENKIDSLSFQIHEALATLIALECIRIAKMDKGINYIGFSGGVAYNDLICSIFCEKIIENGFIPLLHNKLPPGDGGISAGQVFHSLYSEI